MLRKTTKQQAPSTRTRVSFEVGARQLGGHALFLFDEAKSRGYPYDAHATL